MQSIRIERDVVYGHGRVGVGGTPFDRPLKLDIYAPATATAPLPALVMAFGGAFHRGDRVADEFELDGVRNTPVSAYCRSFAQRGFVAFSIDYRLVTEDPDPGDTPVIGDPQDIPMSRIDHVRRLLGLPTADVQTIWAGIEAATDDMACAARFVHTNAAQLGVDPTALVLGGFSAGARIALGAAYGERVAAAAVLALSGYMATSDLLRLVRPGLELPPALFVSGEHDLDYVREQAEALRAHFETTGVGAEGWTVPGGTHFYPADSVAVDHAGTVSTVEAAMTSFVDRVLDRKAVQ